ncbi:MAG: Uma2 family endonuclease [Anaerolineales bacterium]
MPLAPLLETGQRLSRREFEWRYHAHPEIKKAELIEGVVYVTSPVRVKRHSRPHYNIIAWSSFYQVNTPGIWGDDNVTLRLDKKNEFQPDVCLSLEPSLGGRAWITRDDYLTGTPELIIEVAGSSMGRDLGAKKRVYARYGVPEYIVIRTVTRKIDWFVLQKGEYKLLTPDENGLLRSRVFPGLWLDAAAFWAGDMRAVMAALQRGMASPGYAAFVVQLHDE